MSYQPLARKYRPRTFRDLVGQAGMALALTNSIKLGRIPHSIIFTGVRGVGKTTSARLFAKALNCESGPTPDPCGDCVSCKAIEEGRHEDVLEIDGASNTGVDDVRSLREMVQYVPQRSAYKVFIIDEVHMLSQSAFNALLKTLEEPPQFVVFIFATTELQKIPQTILSRCQTFSLKRFSLEELKKRLISILTSEKIEFEEGAVSWVAKRGRGSMRDALTVLDQVIALGNGHVGLDAIESVFGGCGPQTYIELLQAIIEKSYQQLVPLCDLIEETGVDFIEITEELAGLVRHAMVVRELGADAVDFSKEGIDPEAAGNLRLVAEKAAPFDLNRIFRFLMKLRTELDGSHLDRYVFENYVLEWCLDPGLPLVEDLAKGNIKANPSVSEQSTYVNAAEERGGASSVPRERKLSSLRKGLMNEINERAAEEKSSPVIDSLVRESKTAEPQFPATWRELVDLWKQSKPLQARILEEVYLLKYGPDEILVEVNEESMAAGKLFQTQVQLRIREAFAEMFGFKGAFRVQKREQTSGFSENRGGATAVDENLLDMKRKEKEFEKQKLIDDATNDPFTKLVSDTFGAKIDDVHVDL